MIALPAVTLPAAAARPVAPEVRTIPLAGVDANGLRNSPEPEVEDGDGSGQVGRLSAVPLAVTGEMSTEPFSALGVTWTRGSGLGDVAVQVRTRSDGRWTDWSEVEVQPNSSADSDTAEAAAVTRVGTDPLYVGESNGVQVRVDADGVRPRDVQLVLIDPGTSAADAGAAAGAGAGLLGGATAEAAEPRPSYVSRAGWGADERLRSCTPSVSSTLKGGILHTTATSNDYTAAQSAAIMRSMYAYHTQSLGWCDIGYNLLVDKFGTLFEGRYGGVDKPVIGAHTGGFNSYTVGVSMIGNQDLVAPSAATLDTVHKAFAWKFGLHGVNPTGTVTYTSAGGSATWYPAGSHVTKPAISGHRDYSSKSCPGNYAYPLLPSIRTAVAARMASTALQPAATAITFGSAPAALQYGQATVLTGRLTTSAGQPLAGKTVKIYVRGTGTTTWALLSTRTTAADGTFGGSHAAQRNLEYSAQFAQDEEYAAVSRTTAVTVAPVVSARFTTSSVHLGSSVVLKGQVSPVHAGQVVKRQQLIGGDWTTLATTTLSSTGTYSFSVKAVSTGTKTYRIVNPADADHAKGVSPAAVLSVH